MTAKKTTKKVAKKVTKKVTEKQAKPEGIADPVVEKKQEVKRPVVMTPSKKAIMVIGKKFCNVPGAYLQPGKECAIAENVHAKLVKAGTAERLYDVKK